VEISPFSVYSPKYCVILLFFYFYYYIDIVTGSFFIIYLPVLLIIGLYSYKKSIKKYKRALQKAEERSYKEDHELFDD